MIKKVLPWLIAFILFCSLIVPNLGVAFFIEDPTIQDLQGHYLIFVAMGFEILLFAVVGRAKIFFLLQLPFLCWLPIELIYIFRYGAPTSAHILNIIAETSLNETLGYLGGLGIVFLYLIYLTFVIGALIFLWRHDIAWRHRSRWWVLFSIGSLFIINGVLTEKLNREMAQSRAVFSDPDEFVAPQLILGLDEYKSTYPLGLILRLVEYCQQEKVLKETLHKLSNWSSGYHKNTISKQEIYVVVIGESSRADHWSLNGYERNTTPLLSVRNDIINFSNAVSVSATTRTSVPILLSRSSIKDVFESRLKNSWILDFKQQGFKVYWLSTQMPVGTHDTMIGAYANLADEVKYLNLGRYSVRSDFDEVIFPSFEVVLNAPEEKKLIILHTLGSHAPYHFRYPVKFTFFSPVTESNSFGDVFNPATVNLMRNAYDNSVRYTDYVLNEVIELVKKKEVYSALWYISDHGETFIDEGCSSAGHGFGSKNNFHVPLVFWASESFAAENKSLLLAAQQQKNLPVYSADFFDTLMVTVGFKKQEGGFNSFLQENYSPFPRMAAISGAAAVNYDEEYAVNACGKK